MYTNTTHAPLARTVGARREGERRNCSCCRSRQTPAMLRRRERRQARQALRNGWEV